MSNSRFGSIWTSSFSLKFPLTFSLVLVSVPLTLPLEADDESLVRAASSKSVVTKHGTAVPFRYNSEVVVSKFSSQKTESIEMTKDDPPSAP